jgi:hypothetical protein
MKFITVFVLLLSAAMLPAATLNIEYEVSTINAPTNEFKYTYFVSGDALPANHYFDILFPNSVYTSISNGIADGWDLLLFQVNDPTGADGRYSALSMPSTFTGPFSVQFVWSGGGNGPGSQAFELYNDSRVLQLSGTTTLRQTTEPPTGIPEPSTLLILTSGLALLATFKKR